MAIVDWVSFYFTHRPDGIIDASIGPNFPLVNHALADAISSRAPRGAPQPGLSTFWIERTKERIERAMTNGSDQPVASGNVTHLCLDGEHVVASYEFDPDESESVDIKVFLQLLDEWKHAVIEAGGATGPRALPPPQEERVWHMGPGR